MNILGINSSFCPYQRRVRAWDRLAQMLSANILNLMTQEALLEDVPALSQEILQGKIRGRVVVKIS
jgi:acrylyl-CoA reductase (NADPH)